MGEEKEILLRGKVCAYLTCRLMGDPPANDWNDLNGAERWNVWNDSTSMPLGAGSKRNELLIII